MNSACAWLYLNYLVSIATNPYNAIPPFVQKAYHNSECTLGSARSSSWKWAVKFCETLCWRHPVGKSSSPDSMHGCSGRAS